MNIVVVTSVSALAVAVVHSVAFAIGRRIGRYNVVDVVWGLGFVAVAVAAATLGHGDPVRRWLLLALVSTWGLRLSWHMYRKTAGQGEDLPATPTCCAVPRLCRHCARSSDYRAS